MWSCIYLYMYMCMCVCMWVCVWWCACRCVCMFLCARGYRNVNVCGSKRLISSVFLHHSHLRYGDRVFHVNPKLDDLVFLVYCSLSRSHLSLPTLVLQVGLLKVGLRETIPGGGGGTNLQSSCLWSTQLTHGAISPTWHWPSWYNKQKSTKA